MTTRAVLGIDVGTTHTKVGLVTLDGRLLALARSPSETDRDAVSGRAEQDPDAWWAGMIDGVRTVSAGSNAEIVGLSVDAHGPTFVAVDDDGRAVRPAITWQDTRSAAEAAALRQATGLRGWALGVLPAARWLEVHEPRSAAETRWYLTSVEAIALRLTGRAGTFVLPGQTPRPADELRAAGLATDRLAPTVTAGSIVAPLQAGAAAELGIALGVPVVAGVVDAFASFHGAGMVDVGDAVDVGGAAGGFGVYAVDPIEAAGSFTGPAPIPGLWIVGGAMAATGAALDWWRDSVLGGAMSTEYLIAEAAEVPAGADGLVFLPYLAGERSPLWDASARGAFAGLLFRHGRAHLTRAILEAAAFSIRHVAEPILAAGANVGAMRVCGGSARSDVWNRIKADVTGFPVDVPTVLETAVIGSAVIAATAIGAYPDIRSAIRTMTSIARRIQPDQARHATYDRVFEAYVALYPAIAPVLVPLDRLDALVSA